MNTRTATFTPTALRCLFAIALAFTMVLGVAGAAWAQDETTTTLAGTETTAEEAAPTLDYTFTWPTFILTFGLVIAYYIFVFRMSEKEFKGVVTERFGPGPPTREEAP